MIRGELVNLRAIEREDAARVHAWLNEPEVARGWGWSAAAVSLAEVGRRVEGWLAEEGALGRPVALVIETLAGEAVGLAVAGAPERAEARSAEVSLLIGDPARWGQGLGTDALRTLLEACFGGWNLHRVSLRSEAGNGRAHRLYARCGFRREGRLREAAFLDGRYEDVLLFGLLASEWAAGEDGGGGVFEEAEEDEGVGVRGTTVGDRAVGLGGDGSRGGPWSGVVLGASGRRGGRRGGVGRPDATDGGRVP